MQIPLGKPAMLLWMLVITFAAAVKGESPPFPGKRTWAWVFCVSLCLGPVSFPKYFALSWPPIGCVEVGGPIVGWRSDITLQYPTARHRRDVHQGWKGWEAKLALPDLGRSELCPPMVS